MNSIGKHSLLNRLHGEWKAIAEQHPEQKDPLFWKMFFKFMACKLDDYPMNHYRVKRKGQEVKIDFPKSLADVSDSDGMKVQMETQVFADERGYWLWEYRGETSDDTLIYRSLGGRTYDQMREYVAEVREMANQVRKKDPAEADRLEARADMLSVTKQSRNTAGAAKAQQEEVPETKVAGEKREQELDIF